MRTPSALSTSIMLSLLIIVAGAMLIIFIQIDRGYKLPNYYLEQNDIIRQTYQNDASVPAISKVIPSPVVEVERPKPEAPARAVAPAAQSADPEPASAATPALPQVTPLAQNQATPLTQNNDSYPRQDQTQLRYDILFDSPWSPYYQPQHFESMR